MSEKTFGDWDPRTYERAAFVGVRALEGARRDWGESIAAAQRIVAECENLSAESTEELFKGDFYAPLLAACRILDSASRPQSGLSEEDRSFLVIEASLAYSMAGNFPSAIAVLRTLPSHGADNLVLYQTLLALTNPGARDPGATTSQGFSEFASAISTFLQTGGDVEFTAALVLWRTMAIEALQSSETMSASLRGIRITLFQMQRLSTIRVLSRYANALPSGYLSRLGDDNKSLLLPSQYMALQQGLLDHHGNAICAFPTSSGKTLLGELCLLRALDNRPGLVVFVAPYQALAHQVFRAARRHLGRSVQLELLVGGYAVSEELSPRTRPTFVVATPERFDGLLRAHPDFLELLRGVAFDECHVIEQAPRGARVEGLIARLRLQQRSTSSLRIVLLSPATTRESLDRLAEWVDSPSDLVLDMDWRPTARRLAIWQQDGRLTYYGAGDPLTRPQERRLPIGTRHIHWPDPTIPATDIYPQIRFHSASFLRNVAYLCISLFAEHGQPILCICATRAETRQLATQLSEYFVRENPLPPRIGQLIGTISARHPHLKALSSALSVGVAYHNASLPAEIRTGIEDAVQSGEIEVVCATTTLAEGVDLPFRFTILVDWLTWRDTTRVEISGLLLRNIAGRCGRAGYFTEGDTILIDNPLGSKDVPVARLARLRALLDPESASLHSSLALLAQPSVSERVRREIEAVLESQIIAAIPENSTNDGLAESFAMSLLPADEPLSQKIADVTKQATYRLLAGPRPVALAASPLRLTEFGKACSLTGLSAGSCRKLADWIDENAERGDLGLYDLVEDLLERAAQLPEMSWDLVKAYKKGSHSPAKPRDISSLLSMWHRGERRENIFASLGSVRKSKRQPPLPVWLSGLEESSAWDDSYEDLLDFVTNAIQHNLPWLLRSIDRLFPSGISLRAIESWTNLADELEVGVDSYWALDAIRKNCPAPRWVIAPFGRQIEAAALQRQLTPDRLLLDTAFRDHALAELRTEDRVAATATDAEMEQFAAWLASS